MIDNGFDFKECEFINNEMKFYTYEDFLKNCGAIRRLYEHNLSKYGKRFFMWYVYANIHLTLAQKNKAWDYLNSFIEKEDLYILLKGYNNGNRIKK